jgi:hypothetical protein
MAKFATDEAELPLGRVPCAGQGAGTRECILDRVHLSAQGHPPGDTPHSWNHPTPPEPLQWTIDVTLPEQPYPCYCCYSTGTIPSSSSHCYWFQSPNWPLNSTCKLHIEKSLGQSSPPRGSMSKCHRRPTDRVLRARGRRWQYCTDRTPRVYLLSLKKEVRLLFF